MIIYVLCGLISQSILPVTEVNNKSLSDRTEYPWSCSRSPLTVIPPCAGDWSISSVVFGGRGEHLVETWHHHGTPQKEGSDKKQPLQGHLADGARRQDTTEDDRSPPQRVLRACGDPAGQTVWFPTEPFYQRYDVRNSSATGVGAEEKKTLYVCFINLTKAYDSVDRTLLWTVLARFGISQKMISVSHQFHDSMRACVRLHKRLYSGWFAVEHGLSQKYVLAPVLLTSSLRRL